MAVGSDVLASSSMLAIDDTIPLHCYVDGYKVTDSHVDYTIRVQRGPGEKKENNTWTLIKRFSDFDTLHGIVRSLVPQHGLSLPPKRRMGNMESEFLSKRAEGLQVYLDTIQRHQFLANSLPVKMFLAPNDYSTHIADNALRNASMYLRSDPLWTIIRPIHIGWRIRKFFFLLHTEDGDGTKLLTFASLCVGLPVPSSSDVNQLLQNTIPMIKHPHILPTIRTTVVGDGIIVVRDNCSKGSIKDILHNNVSPGLSYARKYFQTAGRPLDEGLVRKWGRQVLEALKFLHDKGFPYGQLHSGNVLINNEGNAQLSELESSLVGLSGYYRQFVIESRHLTSYDQIDMYCFGHLLYEMAFGIELGSPIVDELPSSKTMSQPLRSIIISLLGKNPVLPSAETVASDPYFSDISTVIGKVNFRVKEKYNERLISVRGKLEASLIDAQKRYRQAKRLARMQKALAEDDSKKNDIEKKHKNSRKTKSVTPVNNIERVSSATASISLTGSSPVPPPPPPPPPPTNMKPSPPKKLSSKADSQRGALLSSIHVGKKLKKVSTNDRSAVKL